MSTSVRSGKEKKSLISKTWERCKSFGGRRAEGSPPMRKARSWPRGLERAKRRWSRVAPEGCFSVYVGPERRRFVIRTEYVNHPLFGVLLEEAESEYGYGCDGPLALPCGVERFAEVLAEMESDEAVEIGDRAGCGFSARSKSEYQLLKPPPRFNYCN